MMITDNRSFSNYILPSLASLASLPNDILYRLLPTYLSPDLLGRMASVSRRYQWISDQPIYWSTFLWREKRISYSGPEAKWLYRWLRDRSQSSPIIRLIQAHPLDRISNSTLIFDRMKIVLENPIEIEIGTIRICISEEQIPVDEIVRIGNIYSTDATLDHLRRLTGHLRDHLKLYYFYQVGPMITFYSPERLELTLELRLD